MTSATSVERFHAAARENGCELHGPLSSAAATETLVRLAVAHAAGEEIALADDDLTRELGLDRALTRAGAAVLHPADPEWAPRLSRAAVGLTGSHLAVAATGTMLLVAAPGAPRATSLLPPVHLCAVRASSVVETFVDAVGAVAGNELPSALVWVGGPSRTSDLEMRPTVGVHGPKAVTVVLVE